MSVPDFPETGASLAGSHGQRISCPWVLHAQPFDAGLLDQFESSTIPRRSGAGDIVSREKPTDTKALSVATRLAGVSPYLRTPLGCPGPISYR